MLWLCCRHNRNVAQSDAPLRLSHRRWFRHDCSQKLFSVAQDGHQRGFADLRLSQNLVQVLHARNQTAVELDQDISFAQAGDLRRAVRFDIQHQQTRLDRQVVIADNAAMDSGGLPAYADVAATNPAVLDQPARDILGRIDSDGETDALRGQNHRRVHAHDFPARIDELPAGVARVQGRVGLDDDVDEPAGIGTERPAERADHARSHRAFEAVRIANGDGELADADVLRFTQGRGGEVGRVNAQAGEVGVRVLADQVR